MVVEQQDRRVSRFFVSKTMNKFKTIMSVDRPMVTLALEKVSLLLQRLSVGAVWGRVLVMVCGVVLCWDPAVELCEKLKEVESKNDGSYED